MGKTIGERAMDVSLRAIGSGVAAKELAAALRELREDIAQAIQKQCVYLSLDETVAHIRKLGEPEPPPPVMVLDATPEDIAKEASHFISGGHSDGWHRNLAAVIRGHLKPMPTKETR